MLEAACGTGSISLRLGKAGFDVLATDISPEMLDIAARRVRQAGAGVTFAQMDMRRLSAPPRDFVVAACDGANYLDEAGLAAFLDGAARCLRPGGLLLFDISSAYKLRQIVADHVFFDDSEDVTCLWRNEIEEQSIRMALTFFHREGEVYTRSDEEQVQFIHDTEDVLAALERAGYAAQALGFGTEEAPQPDCQRIQFIAEKREK